MLVKALQDRTNQIGVSSFIKQEDRMGYVIGDLKKTRLFACPKIRDITQISNDAPSVPQLTKLPDPDSCPIIESALRKKKKTPLGIVVVMIPPLQKDIKPVANLFRGMLNGSLPPKAVRFLNNRSKKDQSALNHPGDGVPHILQNLASPIGRKATPETLTSPHRGGVEFYRLETWKMIRLNRV